jgi:GNAT superfamily N-acetyltransferase
MVPDTILDNMDPVRRERGWARLIASDEGSRIDLAELDGRVVGFVASGPAGDNDVPPTAGEVIAIYVDPDLLRIGIGRALLDHAAALLRAAGRSPLVLWVLTANVDGRRFYESLGWQADGAARPIDFAGTPVEEVRYRST